MGVSIWATNAPRSFECGGFGFFNLRKNLAIAWDKEFGEHYALLPSYATKEEYAAFDKKTEKILAHRRFDGQDELADFFFASDCEGSLSYKGCKMLYNAIKDHDFGNKIFTYVAYSDGKDYEHFKNFLKYCYSHRCKMRWY